MGLFLLMLVVAAVMRGQSEIVDPSCQVVGSCEQCTPEELVSYKKYLVQSNTWFKG